MSEERARQIVLSPPSVGSVQREPFEDAGDRTLWSVLDDRLRGRWRPAIVVGFVLAMLFGVGGYLSTSPKYQSGGFIRIVPEISHLLRETAETGTIPLYQNFVQTQARLIGSQRVLERALGDETLAALPPEQRFRTVRSLKRGLTVEGERGSELITVQFEADSAEAAQAAANAVIKAYEELYALVSGDEIGRKLQTLRGHRSDRRSQLREKRAQIREYVSKSEYGAGDFGHLLSSKIARIEAIEQEIGEVEQALALSLATSTEEGYSGISEASSQQLAAFDPELAEFYRIRDELRRRFELIKQRWKPAHFGYRLLEQQLYGIEQMVQQREGIVRAEWEAAIVHGLLAGPPVVGALTCAQLEARLERLRLDAERYRQQIRQISTDQQELENRRAEAAEIEQDVAEIASRIKYLDIEAESVRTGRISIAAYADRPEAPSRDRRHKLAALGVVGGFGLSISLFFLIGMVDRRAYGSAQLGDHRHGRLCLGVVPDLGHRRLDPASCLAAAHCVHQLRNRIEAMRDHAGGFTLVVASPYQGDGKTSLAMALGWSYAAAAHRTVLVDCDFVGASLSQQMGMGAHSGLKEVLRDRCLDGHISGLPVANLSVLASGLDSTFGPEAIRKDDFAALCAELRQQFDIIIVDTGPFVGSVEALPVAMAADGVILVVRRGRRRSRLEQYLAELEEVHARCLGVVLNCADRADCKRHASLAAASARTSPPRSQDSSRPSVEAGCALPSASAALVRAMQSTMRRSSKVTDPVGEED